MKYLLFSRSSHEQNAFPHALANFSTKVAAAKASRTLKYNSARPWERDGSFHAPPLMPLNPRDSIALAGLFERKDIEDIESNVSDVLLALLPQPCWEDNFSEQSENFGFLADYL